MSLNIFAERLHPDDPGKLAPQNKRVQESLYLPGIPFEILGEHGGSGRREGECRIRFSGKVRLI